VYAVLVETGLNRELVGKRLMSATFVTDIATVAGLTILFVKPTLWVVPFALVSLASIAALPRVATWFFARYGNRVIEPEIKLVFAVLFVGKMAPKLAGVYPLARRYTAPHAAFTTLLMSTGLTFGTITSLYGLNAHIIDRTQFSLLISVVVLSAIVPTAIAQRFYQPQAREHRDLTAPVPPAPYARGVSATSRPPSSS